MVGDGLQTALGEARLGCGGGFRVDGPEVEGRRVGVRTRGPVATPAADAGRAVVVGRGPPADEGRWYLCGTALGRVTHKKVSE